MSFNLSFALIDLLSFFGWLLLYLFLGLLALIGTDEYLARRGWSSPLPDNPLGGLIVWYLWLPCCVWWLTRARFYESPRKWMDRTGR